MGLTQIIHEVFTIMIICQAETHAAHTVADLLKTDASAKVDDNKNMRWRKVKNYDMNDNKKKRLARPRDAYALQNVLRVLSIVLSRVLSVLVSVLCSITL